jgi:hypothetical protein
MLREGSADMRYVTILAMVDILLIGMLGCGKRVMVAPRIDLADHETIGIIEFRSSNEGQIASFATEQFMEAIRRDQGLVKIVELGTEKDVLKAIGAKKLTPDALQDIGEKFSVNTIFYGKLDVSSIRPEVTITPGIMSVDAEVDAKLSVKMVEVIEGASIWSGSAMATEHVGSVSVFGGTAFTFDAEDPDEAYGKLIYSLVEGVSRDFQVRWVRQ